MTAIAQAQQARRPTLSLFGLPLLVAFGLFRSKISQFKTRGYTTRDAKRLSVVDSHHFLPAQVFGSSSNLEEDGFEVSLTRDDAEEDMADPSLPIDADDATTPPTKSSRGQPQMANQAQRNACRDLEASTAAFTRAVLEHTEEQALSKFTTQNWEFPPLDHALLQQAFGGRRISFLGDSTLFYMLQNLEIISEAAPLELVNDMPHHNLSAVQQQLADYFEVHPRPDHYDKLWFPLERTTNSTTDNQKSRAMWRGFRGTNQHQNCQFETMVFPKIVEVKPQILVANWGLHMLFRPQMRVCNLDHWFHYEDFLKRVVDVAIQSNVRLLLFKTTNYICPTQKLQSWGNTTSCTQQLRQWMCQGQLKQYNKANIHRYCMGAIMREKSARQLNNRMERLVQKSSNRRDLKGMKIAIFNDHDMESCPYTQRDDGTHYHPLQLPRIRLLAHMINCLLPRQESLEAT